MFAPFTILTTTTTGAFERSPHPTIHWAHVDSGSMVCIVYEGVLDAYPELLVYKRPWRHEVSGIGG